MVKSRAVPGHRFRAGWSWRQQIASSPWRTDLFNASVERYEITPVNTPQGINEITKNQISKRVLMPSPASLSEFLACSWPVVPDEWECCGSRDRSCVQIADLGRVYSRQDQPHGDRASGVHSGERFGAPGTGFAQPPQVRFRSSQKRSHSAWGRDDG